MAKLHLQQGDVLIRRIDSIPEGAMRLNHRTFAEGEQTGHAHVAVAEDVELYEKDGTLYARVPNGSPLTHQEHDTIQIPAGDFQVGIVQEYDYDTEEMRRVQD